MFQETNKIMDTNNYSEGWKQPNVKENLPSDDINKMWLYRTFEEKILMSMPKYGK